MSMLLHRHLGEKKTPPVVEKKEAKEILEKEFEKRPKRGFKNDTGRKD